MMDSEWTTPRRARGIVSTVPVVPFLLLGIAFVACSTSAVPTPELNALIGSWNVADTSGDTIQFGFRIDDFRDGVVTGMMQRVFAGNVGIDVSRFHPLRGDAVGSRLTLRADHDDPDSALVFELERLDGGLRVIAIRWGRESLVRTPNTWMISRG